jgi:hypothetical protein
VKSIKKMLQRRINGLEDQKKTKTIGWGTCLMIRKKRQQLGDQENQRKRVRYSNKTENSQM